MRDRDASCRSSQMFAVVRSLDNARTELKEFHE